MNVHCVYAGRLHFIPGEEQNWLDLDCVDEDLNRVNCCCDSPGLLTMKGKQQHELLGKAIRNVYNLAEIEKSRRLSISVRTTHIG